MVPRLLRLHPKTHRRLIQLSKEAEQEDAYRVAKRLQAVVLNAEGRTSGDLARILKAPRSKVSEWLARYQEHGVEGLLEGYRSGRAARLTEGQYRRLGDILDSGPVAYGLDTGIWTSPMIACGGRGGVRRRLPSWPHAQVAWRPGLLRTAAPPGAGPCRSPPAGPLASLHLSPPLKKAQSENRALIFTDEVSFRQDSTLHTTWSRLGHPPEIPSPENVRA